MFPQSLSPKVDENTGSPHSLLCTVVIMKSAKLNVRLTIRQRADLFEAYISAYKISLPQGQSYTVALALTKADHSVKDIELISLELIQTGTVSVRPAKDFLFLKAKHLNTTYKFSFIVFLHQSH